MTSPWPPIAHARWRIWAALAPVALLLAAPAAASAIEINKDFKPQNEFKLDPWINLKLGPLDLSINKGVFMLVLAGAFSVLTMVLISRRMKVKGAGRMQTIVEAAYGLMHDTITMESVENPKIARRWFPFFATLFLFIWFSNVLGYLPLPLNTEHTVNVLGANLPTFGLYAATANVSVPLALTLAVFFSYHFEGIRTQGFRPYFASWFPVVEIDNKVLRPFVKILLIFVETLSQFVRLISLSARLFANMLAGHMLILIMGGGMVVLLGMVAVAVFTVPIAVAFYIFELGLIASLQAFIFAILAAMYMGGAIAEHH